MKRLKKNYFSGASFLIFSLFAGNVCNFLFNTYLGRALSFEEFGLVTLVTTIWNLVCILLGAFGGAINHRTAFLSTHDNKNLAYRFYRYVERNTLPLTVAVAVVWGISVPFLAKYFHVPTIVLWMLTPSFVVGAVGYGVRGYFAGVMSFARAGVLVLVESISKLLIGISLVMMNLPALVYIAIPASVIFSFLVAEGMMFFERTHGRRSVKKSDTFTNFPRRFFAASLVTGIATTAFLSLDVILAKHYLTPLEAGEYAFLSLVGKMVYFFGSLLNSFVITAVGRQEGAGKETNSLFYRFLVATIALTGISYAGVGLLGGYTLPILFGEKALAIVSYLPEYALAIALYTISGYVVLYHLARKHYLFSFVAMLMAAFVAVGISYWHDSITVFARVLLVVSIINFFVTSLLHFLQRNGEFVLRNLIDLLDILSPLSQKSTKPREALRILVFNWRDTRHLFAGGAEVYVHELAKRWIAEGHEVTVFCGNDSKSPRNDEIDGVKIIRRGGFYFVYLWAFLYYVLKFRGRFDIVIDCQNGIPFFTPLYVKERVICVVHHIHQEVFRTHLSPPLAFIARITENRIMPMVYRDVRFVTVSPSTQKDMELLSMEGAGISIVHNGIDPRLYKPGKKSHLPLVVYVGRLKYYKTLNVFIKAAAMINKQMPMARFVIAGDGEEKKGLLRLVHKLGLEHTMLFTGYISEHKKVQLYQESWVCVNPSLMEGWGITTLEANACGTPVVASDVPGLRDSVKHGESGYLVPHGDVEQFADRILTLLSNTKTREKMGITARTWARQFEWDKSAQEFLTILKEEAPATVKKQNTAVLTPIHMI